MSRKVSTIFTRRLLIYLSVALALAATGCSIFKSEEENDLDAAVALWEDEGYANYSMRLEISGWIGVRFAATVHIEAGRVVAFESDSLLAAWGIPLSSFKSVEELFDIVATAIKGEADFIDVTYHNSLGYPQSVFIDYGERTDSGRRYKVSDVVESQ